MGAELDVVLVEILVDLFCLVKAAVMHGHLFFCFYLFYITCSYYGSSASISVISIRRYLQKNIQNLRVNLTCLV